jgi:hypothetical protein
MGGYLVCKECSGYYKLQPGEIPKDFITKCECGGKLKYLETLESSDRNVSATKLCPYCGVENPEDAKLCKSCKRLLTEIEWNKPSKNNNKQEYTSEIFETWKKQSNGIKALSIISVFCIGLIMIFGVIALISPDKNTQLSAQGASWSDSLLYSINSAINGMISYYDASFKNFFQNIVKTGMRAGSGYYLPLYYYLGDISSY